VLEVLGVLDKELRVSWLTNMLEHQKRYYGWSWANIMGIWFERLEIWRGLLSWEKDALAELMVKHIEREKQIYTVSSLIKRLLKEVNNSC
jgi:hypothetical protein